MTIKKLTVAAAIAVGIATCSFNSANAACPLSGCNSCPTAVSQTNLCPVCGKDKAHCCCQTKSDCGCGCQPAAPACGCGCNNDCGCNSSCGCNNDCGCNSGCGCNNDCGCATPCCKPSAPACATCPSTSCTDLDMKQVYGYPNAIYGTNNYTGEQSNAIYSTESAWCVDGCDALGLSTAGMAGLGQLTGAACNTGCGCGSGASPMCNGCQGGAVVNRNTVGCHRSGYTGLYTAGRCGCNNNMCCNQMPVITGAACGCAHEATPITGCAAPLINDCGCGCGCNNNCCTTTVQTCNSIEALKKSFVPFEANIAGTQCGCGCTGAAAPLVEAFPDVPSSFWAACPIDKLAMNNVVVGYPDRLFKPCRDISRAEFATMMVKGYNLNCEGLPTKSLFKDVPRSHWANALIAKAVEEGIMCGYPGKKFKPKQPVSRIEALTAMAHGINCDMSCEKAQQILGQYCDGSQVPSWAQIPVAKALDSGALKTSLNPNTISPCKDASRAEIADMLQNTRIAMGYDTNPATACACPKPADPCCPKKAYMENEEMVKIPTLKLCFRDEINAKSSNVGDQFAANTSEEVTINGKCYPCGSRVNGKIVEVVRPSGCEKGALKLAFQNIEDCNGCKCDLPKQILTAQIDCARTQNIFSRLIATPFTLVGGLIGTTGRTVGGMIASLGNAAESVSGGTGIALSEVLQGPCQFPAAGRSLQDAAKAAIMAPIDFTRTALAGGAGLFQTTTDEVAYLVDPNGSKISAINPKEKVTIAFGCHE